MEERFPSMPRLLVLWDLTEEFLVVGSGSGVWPMLSWEVVPAARPISHSKKSNSLNLSFTYNNSW